MRIFLKHIFKSFKAHPLQPFFIMLTVTVCVCVSITAFAMQSMFLKINSRAEENAKNMADITLSVSSDSEERMLFSDDVRELLGDRGRAYGEYTLKVFYLKDGQKSLVDVSAADMNEADEYFKFKFKEYGRFTNENLSSSAIISESFAREHGISLGDGVTFEILNNKVTYTVQAIAEGDGYFESVEVLCDIGGVVKLLAQKSNAIAAISDSFAPCNRIMIKLFDGQNAEEIQRELQASHNFRDDHVKISGAQTYQSFKNVMQTVIIFMLAFLVSAICAVVILSSQSILTLQREREYALFEISGAQKGQIAYLMTVESLIYAIFGGVLGIFFAKLLFPGVASVFSWYDGEDGVGIISVIFGVCFTLCFVCGCTWLSVIRRYKSTDRDTGDVKLFKPEKTQIIFPAILFACLCLTYLCMLCVPVEYRYILCIIAVILLITFIYNVSFYIFHGIAVICDKIFSRTSRTPIFLLSLKSIRGGYSQKHMGRLLCLIFSLLLTVYGCVYVANEQEQLFDNLIKGEIIGVGLSGDKYREIAEHEDVRGISSFEYHTSAELNSKYSALAVCLGNDADMCFAEEIVPDKMPMRGEVVISKGIASLAGVKAGDIVNVAIDGNDYDLKVSQIQDSKLNIIVLSPDDVKMSQSMTVINVRDGGNSAVLADEIQADGGVVIEFSDLNFRGIYTIKGFMELLKLSLAVAAAVSVMGFFNMLAENLHRRKNERSLLTMSGMTSRDKVRMNVYEVIFLLLISAALGLVFGGGIFMTANIAAKSFGFVFV